MSKEIKIFYSWQSDLDSSVTRNLIQNAIDAAVKSLRGVVNVVADRDTKGSMGSPNIEELIFEKINSCDLFVADISIVNKDFSSSVVNADEEVSQDENKLQKEPTEQTSKSKRYSPNPNVLIELGYAAATIGWDNIICFMNTDFGEEDDLPFDLSHHRVAAYTCCNGKADAKRQLRDIIVSNVMDVMENGLRAKGDFADHIVGAYDCESKSITRNLTAIDVKKSQWATDYRSTHLAKSRELIEEIINLNVVPNKEECNKSVDDGRKNSSESTVCMSEKAKEYLKGYSGDFSQTPNIDSSLHNLQPLITIKDDVKEQIKKQTFEFFEIELSDDFFYLGSLRKSLFNLPMCGPSTSGTDAENEKYEKIHALDFEFLKIKLLDKYLKTFDNIILLPLAITNRSAKSDNNLSVSITIDEQTASVVYPDKNLFNNEICGAEGLVYDEDHIKGLFLLPNTADISLGIRNSITLQPVNYPIPNMYGVYSDPASDEEDYEREIQEYIAAPINREQNEFVFELNCLRPKENAWLGIIAVKIVDSCDHIDIHYKIKSEYSDGTIEGNATYKCMPVIDTETD